MWPCLMHGLMIATMALKPTLLVSTHATTAHLTDVRTGGELTRHLLKCKKLQDWETASAALWWALDERQALLQPKHFNVVISTLASARPNPEWERALMFLEEMHAVGLRPDAFSYSAAISACSRAGQVERALAVFKQCSADHEEPPNSIVFNAVLAACQRGGAAWRAQLLALFASMSAHGVQPDAWAHSAAIDALSKTGQWKRALSLVDELEAVGAAGGPVRPDSHVYGAAMRACTRVGQWQNVIKLHERMRAHGVAPTVHTLSIVLSACAFDPDGDGLGWQRAQRIMNQEKVARTAAQRTAAARAGAGATAVRAGAGATADACPEDGPSGAAPTSAGTALNVHCYTAAARAYASGGRWAEARDLLLEMKEAKVRPNAHTFTAVIKAFGQAGKWQPAVGILRRMRSAGVHPDAHAVHAALRAVGRAGQWEEAAKLVLTMEADLGVPPTAVHATTALGIFAAAKRPREGAALLAELMDSHGLRPDAGLCDVALGVCARAANGELAIRLVRMLQSDGVHMTSRMRRCAIVALCRSGEWAHAYELLPPLRADVDGVEEEEARACHRAVLGVMRSAGEHERAAELEAALQACGIGAAAEEERRSVDAGGAG